MLSRTWCISEALEVSGPVMAAVARSTAALPQTQKQQMLTECLDLVTVHFISQQCLSERLPATRMILLLTRQERQCSQVLAIMRMEQKCFFLWREVPPWDQCSGWTCGQDGGDNATSWPA